MPASHLGRVRLGMLVFALFMPISLPTLMQPGLSAASDLVSACGALGLIAMSVMTYRRRAIVPGAVLLLPAFIVAQSTGLRDPLMSVGIAIAIASSQSLYGSRRGVLIRTPLLAAAVPITVALSSVHPSGDFGPLSSPVMSLVPGVLIFSVLMRSLLNGLLGQERAMERERVLASTNRRLLGCTDSAQVRDVFADAVDGVARSTPGLKALVLRDSGDDLTVIAAYGGNGRKALGSTDDRVGRGVPRLWADGADLGAALTDVPGAADALAPLAGAVLAWQAWRLPAPDDRDLLVVSHGPSVTEVADAMSTLVASVRLAAAGVAQHAELVHRAHHDDLTTMPNRASFSAQLFTAVDGALARRERGPAVLMIDLDDFKDVNDRHGHAAGDAVLVETARRMDAVVGSSGCAARFGGDEFAVLLTDAQAVATVDAVARTLLMALVEPIDIGAVSVRVGASVGVADAAAVSGTDLLRRADIAMYAAKAKGKNRVEVFAESEHGDIALGRILEEHLGYALTEGEIQLDYQPMVDLATGRCLGVEALCRWTHPTMGAVAPDVFLPLAERNGYVVAIGGFVIRTACRQLATWRAVGGLDDLTLSVNVSAGQLRDPGFAQFVADCIAEAAIPASRLVLDLLEGEELGDERTRFQLAQLHALGVGIAIDDFGVHYASLELLQALAVRQVKIDRQSVVERAGGRADAMLDLILSVARFLSLETVAERVETAEHVDWARRAGISLAQGLAFAEPMDPVELTAWLADVGRPRSSVTAA